MGKDKGGLTSRQLRRRKEKNLILTWSLVLLVVVILVGVVGYYYIMSQPKTVDPRPDIVDAVGYKAVTTDGSLSAVRFTFRNNGTGSIDLMKVSLQFDGPKVQTKLLLDKSTYANATKDDFGVAGSGEPSDGWDPAHGKFLVKGQTLASLIVDLTAAHGINDQLGPHDTVKVTVTIDGGDGSGRSTVSSFSVPANLGSGTYIALQPIT